MIFGEWHAGLPVRVSRMFPFEAKNPKTGEPEMVHGCIVEGVLFCSEKAYEQLKKYWAKEKP